jgi:hypothetical protein
VNFFGHAAVAAWQSPEPGFVLGAMLPDFAAMIGARPPNAEHAALAAGIRHHHFTDQVFHDAADFRGLVTEAFEDLLARGVRRGSARAVAHVGVEILLDGVLARDAASRRAYLGALGAAGSLCSFVVWRDASERARFDALRAGLEARGITTEHAAPDAVVFRLSRALARRPRLALDAVDEPRVRAWAEQAAPRVEARAGSLLDELRRGLGASLERVEIRGKC